MKLIIITLTRLGKALNKKETIINSSLVVTYRQLVARGLQSLRKKEGLELLDEYFGDEYIIVKYISLIACSRASRIR
jgi:hypothetical protein